MAKRAAPDRFAGSQNCFPLGGLTIQWAFDPAPLRSGGASSGECAAVKDVSVDHRCFYVFVPEELLNSPYIVSIFEEMSGKL